MSEHADYLYALEIQRQLNGTEGGSDIEEIGEFKPTAPAKRTMQRCNPHSNLDEEAINCKDNLVHPLWETLDPTPDIHSLFGAFDARFFQSRLKCVTLEWSKRMYSCAGICYSRSNRFGMDVTIRLSEPLLKLRPRKDLVETMLHEMIHAYCFVLNIREGNGGHGPNFKKIMYGINKVAGTNITVYHTFHDEVDLYKQHWWRCNGVCQHRSPFFGYVKRTCNRAPSPNDQWWSEHVRTCGGTFWKVKGPELKSKKEKSTKAIEREKKQAGATSGSDVRKYFSPINGGSSNNKGFDRSSSTSNSGFKGSIKSNGGGTMLLNPNTKLPSSTFTNANTKAKPGAGTASIATAYPPSSYPGPAHDPFKANAIGKVNGGNLVNVKGFSDLTDKSSFGGSGGNAGHVISNAKRIPNRSDMLGAGYSLSSSNASNDSAQILPSNNHIDRDNLRNLRLKRFGGGNDGGGPVEHIVDVDVQLQEGNSKRRRISASAGYIADEAKHTISSTETENEAKDWVIVDDDLMLRNNSDEVIAVSSDSDSDDCVETITRPNTSLLTAAERQNAIKQEILDESMDTLLTNDDIELIDDEYNDDEDLLNAAAVVELADTSLIDDLFGEDTLLTEFKRENDVRPSRANYTPNPLDDIITCAICQGKMKRSELPDHLDGCTGLSVKVVAPKHAHKKLAAQSKLLKPTRRSRSKRQTQKDLLHEAGYSEQDLANITFTSSADDEEDFLNASGLNSSSASRPPTLAPPTINLNSSDECDESSRRYRQRSLYKTTIQCPACAQEIEQVQLSSHLAVCLNW